MRKVTLDNGKYATIINDTGSIVDILRHGEHWPVGMSDLQYCGAFRAAIWRIAELEDEVKELEALIEGD